MNKSVCMDVGSSKETKIAIINCQSRQRRIKIDWVYGTPSLSLVLAAYEYSRGNLVTALSPSQ